MDCFVYCDVFFVDKNFSNLFEPNLQNIICSSVCSYFIFVFICVKIHLFYYFYNE